MNILSRICLVALLSVGVAHAAMPTTAIAQSCTSATCGSGTGGGPFTAPTPERPDPKDDKDDKKGNKSGWPKFPPPPQGDPEQPEIVTSSTTTSSSSATGQSLEERGLLAISCDVGSTEARSDRLWLANIGTADLPAGLKLGYAVPETGDRGAFILPRTIPVGEKGAVQGLISGLATTGTDCRVQILG